MTAVLKIEFLVFTDQLSTYVGYFFNLKAFIIWQYGLWSFQMGGTKLERCLPRNQHKNIFFNFENIGTLKFC